MSRNCFLMTGEAVNLTPGIGLVGGGAFEFTLRRESEVAAVVILKTNVFGGCRKGVVGRVDRRIRADDHVAFEVNTRGISRERRVPFAGAVAEDAVAVRGAVRDVVSVDEAGRRLAVQRHDVPALEVRVVTQ